MASGIRLKGESFESYRERLKKEHAQIKTWLRGRLIWFSAYVGPHKDDINKPPKVQRLVKRLVNGTYRKEA